MDIRNTEKPNVIATTDFDDGSGQPSPTGWHTAAPTSDNDVAQDPYSPQMLGGDAIGSSDHNSEWLNATRPE